MKIAQDSSASTQVNLSHASDSCVIIVDKWMDVVSKCETIAQSRMCRKAKAISEEIFRMIFCS
jgi:hypothetical protein